MGVFEAMSATSVKNSSRPLRTTPSANLTAGLRLRISRPWSSYRAHGSRAWRDRSRSCRSALAEGGTEPAGRSPNVPTATAPSTHRLGFVVAGRLWADSGITSKWTDSRLNRTREMPSPSSEKPIWKRMGPVVAQGVTGSLGRGRIGVRKRRTSWPRRTKTSTPAPMKPLTRTSVSGREGSTNRRCHSRPRGVAGCRCGSPRPGRRAVVEQS